MCEIYQGFEKWDFQSIEKQQSHATTASPMVQPPPAMVNPLSLLSLHQDWLEY